MASMNLALMLASFAQVSYTPMRCVCTLTRTSFPQVCACADARGRGAFAKQRIMCGTCIGEYEGELLNEEQFWARYPSGMVMMLEPGDHLLPLHALFSFWHASHPYNPAGRLLHAH